jgi:hypothetical protein
MALGTSKPVCYYQFENNAYDDSNAGNTMDGTLVGGSYSTAAKVRGTYSYLGNRAALPTDCIHSCGSDADISFINTGVFTISYWTRLSNANSTDYVMGTEVGSGAKDFLIGWVGKKIRFKRYGHTPADVDYYSGVTAAGNDTSAFHHIAITCDASNISFYVDGALESSAASTGWGAGTMGCALMLGAAPQTTCTNPYSVNYRGYLDEVSLWDAAATADEVASLYNSGASRDLRDGLSSGGLPDGINYVGGVAGSSVKTIVGIAASSVKKILGMR